jgi:molecular chaperone GrpE
MMKKTKRKHGEATKTSSERETDRTVGKDNGSGASAAATEQMVEKAPAEADSAEPKVPVGQTDPVEELRAKAEKLEESLLRARADYQNLQRRSAVERTEAVRFANADLMRPLLGVLDDFERALEAANQSDNLQAVVDGVRLVYDNLQRALCAEGLEPIGALHEPFDPNIHQAIMQRPSADYPPGTVVEEIAKGYRFGNRVLRPAKVIVSKSPGTGEH